MSGSGSELDLDFHTGGQIQTHQRFHGLGAGVVDVDQALVGAALELLPAVLVLVDGAKDGDDLLLGGQGDGAGDGGASSLRSGRSADGHRPSGGSESFRSVPCCCVPPKKHTKCHCLCHASYGGESDTLNRAYHSISMKKTGILRRLFPLLSRRYTPCSRFSSRPIHGHTPRKLPVCTAISRIIADCAHSGAHIYYYRFCPVSTIFCSPTGKHFPQKGRARPPFFCPSLHFSETVG